MLALRETGLYKLPVPSIVFLSFRILSACVFHFISRHFFLWHWVVTVMSVPYVLTRVTVPSCQNYLEATNYKVSENLEGFSLTFAPFHTKDPDPGRRRCALYEHRAMMTYSSCAECFKVTGFFRNRPQGLAGAAITVKTFHLSLKCSFRKKNPLKRNKHWSHLGELKPFLSLEGCYPTMLHIQFCLSDVVWNSDRNLKRRDGGGGLPKALCW